MGAIVKGIVESGLMVVLVSRSSVRSKNVLREMTIADDEQVPLIPYHLEQCALSDDFRFFLSVPQRLQAYEHSSLAALQLLREAVAASVSTQLEAAPGDA